MTVQYDRLVGEATETERRIAERAVPRVYVDMSGSSVAVGAEETLAAIRAELVRRKIEAEVVVVGNRGIDWAEPVVDVELPGGPRIAYGPIASDLVQDFLDATLTRKQIYRDLALFVVGERGEGSIPAERDHPFMRLQTRQVMANCGVIDPLDLDAYVARGGFAALHRALSAMSPEQVIETIKASGLTGRGGAAFPTGRKWESARASKDRPKYLIDNGEEGEPAIYKDRRLYEGDPFKVIEGVLINAYAIGADHGYIYVGGEHRHAIERVGRALEILRSRGLLGANILGTDFSIDVELRVGGGSYAAGESSAMMSSIEGRRAMPRPKLVRSTERGVWAKPTCMNNVETHANVPLIIQNGAEWYASIGTAKSKGTKIFAVSGHVKWPGLIEVPMGLPLRQMIYEVCGGMKHHRVFKAAQPAGVSSAPISASDLDVPMAIETLEGIGAILGSGGLVIFDESVCMVDMNLYLVNFNELESCSRCVTCRVGTMRLTDILSRLCAGQGRAGDLEALTWLGPLMEQTTLCGLGQAAPIPVVGAMNLFRSEFEAHLEQKRCPAGFCEALTSDAKVLVGAR